MGGDGFAEDSDGVSMYENGAKGKDKGSTKEDEYFQMQVATGVSGGLSHKRLSRQFESRDSAQDSINRYVATVCCCVVSLFVWCCYAYGGLAKDLEYFEDFEVEGKAVGAFSQRTNLKISCSTRARPPASLILILWARDAATNRNRSTNTGSIQLVVSTALRAQELSPER
ncbi:hypothetical protein PAAG_12149 [Paracoccidioides lutzii Pb01]|uniref:Uncharacterized protein n=1 Tax=Paracoccidioides lutzii (strain ATCC MYA-826 / Pb01) TaxID=502779 RepID=A0A0A2UZY5_PARBA|nr:hypothetical protein PAAG_12149 [Paracoccidioides lutzii Pb01]KGQ01111.1 hypothetical protein PAAG_12149 [Paracoccidioides lutzii Pb01]